MQDEVVSQTFSPVLDSELQLTPDPVTSITDPPVAGFDSVEDEINFFLPRSSGNLGAVAACLRDGISDRSAMVEAGAAANNGAVGNLLSDIRAIRTGRVPTAPSLAREALSATRSFRRQHRNHLSVAALQHLDGVVEALTEALSDRSAQEREEDELHRKGSELEEALLQQGGVYVYTYPHYYRYPTVDGTSRTLLKVGMTTKDPHSRVTFQARQTGMPEDPLLLRVYQSAEKEPREVERAFHQLLLAADHDRGDSTAGGREWFETSLEFLDTIASVLGLVRSHEDDPDR